jgi:hypothetical protein
LCDNCSGHCFDEVLNNLPRHEILLIAYPRHTSHASQFLGVLLFGILKRAKKYQRRDEIPRREVDHVLRLFRAYDQATVSMTIRASWGQTRFEYERCAGATYVIVHEAKTRRTSAFCEVWKFNQHPKKLSPQRLSQRWINQH